MAVVCSGEAGQGYSIICGTLVGYISFVLQVNDTGDK